jgi:hypothetical protein
MSEYKISKIIKKANLKVIAVVFLAVILFSAWAPWLTEEYAIGRVTEILGGPDATFNYLGETMPVKDVPKNVVRVPFASLVYFPGEALFVVTLLGTVV